MSKKDGKTFESYLKEIEAIVDRLESGDLNLDKAMEQYEQGMEMIKKCRALLKQSKMKIELLKKKTEKGYEAEPFENDGEGKKENEEEEEEDDDEENENKEGAVKQKKEKKDELFKDDNAEENAITHKINRRKLKQVD